MDPTVIVGGHLARTEDYRDLAATLRRLSGSETRVADLTLWDWVVGRFTDYEPVVSKIAATVEATLRDTGAEKVTLVGHSAGGLLCRSYLGDKTGRTTYIGYGRVSRLITLASPHRVRTKRLLSPFARVDEPFLGAFYAPSVRYLSVAGSAVSGEDSFPGRLSYGLFVADGRVAGDSVIPVPVALLPGSETCVLDDVLDGVHRNTLRYVVRLRSRDRRALVADGTPAVENLVEGTGA